MIVAADDFIVTPGPPGAPDTPTKIFCFITRSSLQIDERLCEQADFLFSNPSVADQLKEIHQRIDKLENQAYEHHRGSDWVSINDRPRQNCSSALKTLLLDFVNWLHTRNLSGIGIATGVMVGIGSCVLDFLEIVNWRRPLVPRFPSNHTCSSLTPACLMDGFTCLRAILAKRDGVQQLWPLRLAH